MRFSGLWPRCGLAWRCQRFGGTYQLHAEICRIFAERHISEYGVGKTEVWISEHRATRCRHTGRHTRMPIVVPLFKSVTWTASLWDGNLGPLS